jgi:hypothetical protein
MKAIIAMLAMLCAWAPAIAQSRALMLRKSEAFLRQGFGM